MTAPAPDSPLLLLFACSVAAFGAAAGSPLAVLCIAIAYLVLKRLLLLRPLSEFELLPHDIPCTEARVESWLRERDQREAPLQPGAESAVQWARAPGVATELCIVSLHGWGACPRELSPVPERLAGELGANLLRFRYTAHGLQPTERGGEAMLAQQNATVLRADAATAFSLGALLGKRVVLLGCSTGGSLSLWLAAQPWTARALAGLVLVSPGLRLTMPALLWEVMSWVVVLLPPPAARAVLRAANGGPHKEPKIRPPPGPRADALAMYWTRRYPIGAALHPITTFRLISASVPFERIGVPVLSLGNPRDPVNSFEAMGARQPTQRSNTPLSVRVAAVSPTAVPAWQPRRSRASRGPSSRWWTTRRTRT